MKKLATLLFIFALMACSDDNNEQKQYYNPVEGEWEDVRTVSTTTYRTVNKYFDDYTSAYFIYENDKLIEIDEIGKYRVEGNKLIYDKGYVHEFKIVEDTLWVGSSPETTRKYIRVK